MLHSIQKILNRVFSTDGDGSLTGLLSSQQALNAVFDEERNALRVKIPDLPPAGAQIDDESTAGDKAWSAQKIGQDLAGKAAASHTHTGMVTSATISQIVSLTQDEYDALAPGPDSAKLYVIVPEDETTTTGGA
ncbi:hypothetical protein [Desulfatiglans anilini]|uniref:hypothetical protein n=1 Tax=Desulfatiglans anilini TaxID=90728 RepID=UPI000415F8E1|nr:hypothetical protein [Desulfatiglans anilini]